jgi:glycosyltransferase involved in cell wall biosynthesis
MLVLHLITRFNQGGTAQWLKHLSNGLEPKGVKVLIATGSVSELEIEDPWLEKSPHIRVKSLAKGIDIFKDVSALIEIRKIILEVKPDVLNTHTSKAGALGRLAAASISKKNRPYIVHTYHGHLMYGYFGSIGSSLVVITERILSYLTDYFIVSGNQVAFDLESAGILTKKSFKNITPGLPNQKLASRIECRISHGVSEDSFVVGWLGRLAEVKDPLMLLSIAVALPDVIFLVGGEGELKDSLVSAAPRNVKFLGWINQEDFWPACDIALLTSRNEAQPYVLIEAIHAGKAIVARNVGSVRDVMNVGAFGTLFEKTDDAILQINKIKNDVKLLEDMSKSAITKAKDAFSLASFVNDHIFLYGMAKRRLGE